MKKEQKRVTFNLILSCWLTYTLSICLKMAYGASMTAIKDEYQILSDLVAGLPVTLYYITYAVIQIVLVVIIAKIHLRRYLLFTCVPAGLLFVNVFIFSPVWYLNAVMALGGVLLGAVWCGSVQLFKRFLSPQIIGRVLLLMGAGFSAGSALSFGIAALAMKWGNWRFSFLIIGVSFLLATVYMLFSVRRAEAAGLDPGEEVVKEIEPTWQMPRASIKPLIVMALLVTLLQSILYYGFATWMPTILKSNFDLADERAALLSVTLPIVTYVGPIVAKIVSDRLKNDFASVAVLAGVSSLLALILYYVYHLHLVLTITLIVCTCVFLRSINMLLGSLMPVHAGAYINAGSTVALVNASASVAAAVSPLMIGGILDASGRNWSLCFLILFGLTAATLVIPILFAIADTIRRHREYKKKADDVASVAPASGKH